MSRDPRPSADVVSQEIEGEVVLVHLGTNRIYALNETGARLWALLDAGYAPPRIQHELGREFDVDPGELEQQINALLDELAREGLLTYPDD
jgi:hypothetical protein